jgi:large subunit ribosomal protein L12e
LGLNPKKVGEDIQKATLDWKGLKVTVKLVIQNRQAAVELVPSSSSMVIRELKEPVRDRKKGPKNVKHNGNLTIDQVIAVAKVMRPRSMSRKFAGTVKEILGTCHSVGCTVNDQPPKEICRQIDAGELDIPDL